GAEAPVIVRANGHWEEILTGGTPIAVHAGEQYEESTALLAPGDVLALTSDGIMEARSDLQFFGVEGLVGAAVPRRCAGLADISEAIMNAAKQFAGGRL